jgi:UDPglucose--hexose-1-phosphate uridylyltransferase
VPEGVHRRHNPLLDEWVLVSPHRLERPWQGSVEDAIDEALPAYDPSCYLCPGNPRAGGERNPGYASTFAFDNDFPALVKDAAPGPFAQGLLQARPERGVCRVLCFTPRHDLRLALMDEVDVRVVIDLLAEETRALEQSGDFGSVIPFENRGAAMGCSNPHPHAQVWATGEVPTLPARKARAQEEHRRRHGRDLLGDYLEQEVLGPRLVCVNEDWVALVPFWAVWPYETMLLPRRRVDSLSGLERDERASLAEIVRRMAVRYDNLFRCPCPYSLAWHGRPRVGGDHPGWRLHAAWMPPLLRSATVRKFLVGYELAGEPQRDLTPEAAAQRLRDTPERHYRGSTGG